VTSFALRRALPALSGLLALLVGVGFLGVVYEGLPLWSPFAFALVLMALQYAITPWLIERLVPAHAVLHDGTAYRTDHPLGENVARRCRDAGIGLVTLGVVEDGNPNAFTFGHHRGDARVWVTTGLLERLDADELDAVIAHEIAHVKNNDVLLMTAAAAVPLALYFVYVTMRGTNREEVRNAALAAYVGYLLSQLVVLSLSRARESTADHWSCATTGNGAALASALVKVAYGMGEVRAAQQADARALAQEGRKGRRASRKAQKQEQRSNRRVGALSVLGIADPRAASATTTIMQTGLPEARVRAAMRWELHNPWGRVLEKLSSHPLTARRIDDLARSGLPGAPRGWGDVTSTTAEQDAPGATSAFLGDVAIMLAPYAALGYAAWSYSHASNLDLGIGLIAAGVLFFVKQVVRYPSEFAPVDEVTSLLERIDASPMRGIPVSLRAEVVGRGMPGYLLSADLAVKDASGFLTLLYRQPLPFWGGLFALFKAQRFLGQEVLVRGWYRRGPGPYVELRDVTAADGTRSRCWEWLVRYAGAVVLVLAGMVAVVL
jgi:Zn-dependent protease with chaperone function